MLERDVPARLRWRRALSRSAVFGTLTSLLIVVVGKLLPTAAPSAGIMPSFYVVYIGQIFDVAFLSANLINVVHYVRSEEHTSELQSLMRNSYAVFCLKK